MYKIRLLTESDYDLLCEWWAFWNFPAPSREFLPNNGVGGIMVLYNDVPASAAFLYITNSLVAWLEFVVTNPDIKDKQVRKDIKEILIRELTESAKSLGKKYVYTSLKNESLIKDFEACGYLKGSSNCQEMVAVL